LITKRFALLTAAGLVWLSIATPASGQTDLTRLGDEAVQRVQEYLRINTINPPGNESRAVEFFARIFEAEGIEYETAESAPGRGNIWARLEGGDEPALVLLHHSDVVPADDGHWDHTPLSGALDDGYIYGRGALDTKALGILHLQTFLALHRAGTPLNRDVIFMATADEEAGGFYGAGWLVENRPEIFEGVGSLLNEGGGGTLDGERKEFGVEVTQKVPIWLRLTATAQPGHGSTPRVQSAATKMVHALARLHDHSFAPRIVPAVDDYFKGIAPRASDEWRPVFSDMSTAIEDPELLLKLQLYSPFYHALTRNTCSITRFEGSNKINVVSPEVWAEIDCRMLPDQDPGEFVEELRSVFNDPAIAIEQIMAFSPAVSTTDTDLYRSIEGILQREYPDASIVPTVAAGFTDSHFFRDLGIVSYGFAPTLIPLADDGGVHGNNERISEENVRVGTRLMFEVVERVVVSPIP
jgi:acetylornithine deacetylase/succinyl-diaminopimelate desuccinylase-like protein